MKYKLLVAALARINRPVEICTLGAATLTRQAQAHRWALLLIVIGVFLLGAPPVSAAADDYSANTSTTGTVVVGGSQTGELESHGDVDWIRVTLVGGTRYVIDYDGSANGQGTLSDPYFPGVYDSDGNLIAGTKDDNGGLGRNSRIDFTPGSSGTYFLGLGGVSSTGTYRVSVSEFDDYVIEVLIPGDDYEDDMTTTGSVSVGGSAVGNFQKAHGPSDSDFIRVTTETFWTYFDYDWFRVTFDAGKTYRVHIKGSWTDHGTLRDTRIAGIYDSNGNLIDGTVDDNSGIDKEARTIFTAPSTGTHYISATRGDFPFPAQDSGTYTVKVEEIGGDDYAANTSTTGSVTVDGSTTGTIERLGDLDWFAVTLTGYATYRFDLEGIGEDWPLLEGKFIRGIYDSNGNVFAGTYTPESRDDDPQAVFSPKQGGTYYVAVGAGETFFGTGEYRVSATKFIPEVSDWLDTQGRIGVGSYVAGAIEAAHDRDWFRVTLEAGTTYRIDLEGSPTSQGTLRDPYLYGIRDSEGDLISSTTDDNDGDGANSRVHFKPNSDGTYYISAGALFGRVGTYRLSVKEESFLSVSDASANEASGAMEFTVTLSPASSETVSVYYHTVSGTATAEDDYKTIIDGRVVFWAGETSKTVSVILVNDSVEDSGETFTLELYAPWRAEIADAKATGTILNTEGAESTTDPEQQDNSASDQQNNPATGAPAISGTPQVGETLTADTANIADTDGLTDVSYSYQWTAGGSNISGATHSSFTLTASQQGQTIQVRIDFEDDAGNSETLTSVATNAVAAKPTPLTASFSNVPDSHDGSTEFTFTLTFSENVNAGYARIRDHAFTESGGDVKNAVRVTQGSNQSWTITVEPDGNGAVSITLPTTTDCAADGAICTADGKKLSGSVGLTVNGPEQQSQEQQNNPATGEPAISGAPQVGETLTASTSGIADADGLTNVSYSYQWIAGGSDIGEATGSSYLLTSSEQGKTIQVKVSFTDDADNEETLTSEATVAVVVAAPAPLTASFLAAPSSHDGSAEFTFDLAFSENVNAGFARIRDDAFTITGGDINQAQRKEQGSNQTWTITVEPEGNGAVSITLPATTDCDADGAICTADGKKLSGRVELTLNGPEQKSQEQQNNPATGEPTISGTPQVGETLTASTSDIADTDGLTNVSYSYQWTAGGSDIDGATASTYTLTSSEQGQTVQVRVTFTDDAGNEESLTSVATAQVEAKPNNPATGAPAISGTPQVGETLTASTSDIADTDGLTSVSYSYQWTAGGSDISGATSSSYTLAASQQGQTVQVRVTFTDDAGNAESLTSAATTAVAPRPPLTASFQSKPSAHDGQTASTFELRFSEEFGISYITLRDHAFTVTDGTVDTAQRLTQGSNVGWTITVTPNSSADVTIELPATTDCGVTGAICTGDGRKLSNSLNFTVSGPRG